MQGVCTTWTRLSTQSRVGGRTAGKRANRKEQFSMCQHSDDCHCGHNAQQALTVTTKVWFFLIDTCTWHYSNDYCTSWRTKKGSYWERVWIPSHYDKQRGECAGWLAAHQWCYALWHIQLRFGFCLIRCIERDVTCAHMFCPCAFMISPRKRHKSTCQNVCIALPIFHW